MQTQMDGGSVMDKFTASNGVDITIRPERDETYLLGKGGRIEGGTRHWTVATANMDGINALREFFQAERDEELGRWRWPDNPDCIVYPREHRGTSDRRRVVVVNEASGLHSGVCVEGYTDEAAALAWFTAHPERKPWEDAEEGEGWLLTVDGAELLATVEGTNFWVGASMWPATDEGITTARRIYPEDAS
jgi:hypothetical protein